MPRTVVIALSFLVVALGCRTEAPDAADDAQGEAAVGEVADVGLSTPESVLHDPVDDVYLVSNINGHPQERSGNGFISRISPDGDVLDLRWIDGEADGVTLHAPKGMAVAGDLLWVSDVDALRAFDRRTGRPLGEVPAPGSFPNDVCAGPDGSIWWTDSGVDITEEGIVPTGTDAVHRLHDWTLETAAQGDDLGNPNGCLATEDGVIVLTFGANRVLRLDADGVASTVAELPTGGLDGIVQVDGAYYITSWEGSAVYRVDGQTGEATRVREGLPQPADLGYDADRHRLLVPLFGENRLVFLPL